jgi:hypothetical protein
VKRLLLTVLALVAALFVGGGAAFVCVRLGIR